MDYEYNFYMKKFVVFTAIFFLFLALSAVAAFKYSDVNSANNYSEDIQMISDLGIVKGYDDGTYKPYQTLNRAELLKIIIEASFEDEFEAFAGQNCFSDVPASEWYTKYVCFAKDRGIVEGYSNGRFEPDQEINFVEALKITLKGFDYEYGVSDPWYKSIVEVAESHNFIPLSVSYFDQSLNRGQMADLIARILKEDKTGTVATYAVMKNNTDNRLVLDGSDQCFSSPDACSSDQVCFRDTCVDRSRILPQNEELSKQNCKYDEVYVDGQCEKAKLNLFLFSIEEDKVDMLDKYVNDSMATFIAASEMSNCPEKIRFRKNFNICLPNDGDVGQYIFDEAGGPIHYVFVPSTTDVDNIHPECSQNMNPGEHGDLYGYYPFNSNNDTFTHELGHVFGLWDQYCYFPSDKNPNIVDFEEAMCEKPQDDAHEWYCAREDLGASPETAYECYGNLNPYGGRSVMGAGGESTSYEGFGYTAAELSYLKEELNCY